MSKISGIVFDMDGVLIDAKDWHFEALNRALSLFGFEINRYEHLVTFDGLPTKKKLEVLSRDRGLPNKLHDFIDDLKQAYTVELIFRHCKPMFQHEYALARLKQSGYKLALASNSIRRTIELMMDRANLLKFFDLIVSNQDVKQPKPHPEMYLKATEALGIAPKECLVVEDNEKGFAAAEAAGCHILKVGSVHDVSYDRIMNQIESIGRIR
jgi:HAD superfamily hydrolase (TIGR01509 family)